MKKAVVFFYLVFAFIFSNTLFSFSQDYSNTDTAFIDQLNKVSFQIIKDNPDSSQRLALEAIQLSTPENYLYGLGDAYVRLGIIEKDKGNYQLAIGHYKKSLGYRKEIGDQDLVARVYNNIGSVFTKQSQYDSAAYYLLNALKAAETLGLKSAQAMYSMNLGITYERNKDFDLAVKYNHQAFEMYRSEVDSVGMLKCLINEGGIYFAMHKFSEALPVYRSAVSLAEMLWR